VLLALAKENKLDIELVDTRTPTNSADYIKLHALDRVPTYQSADGWVLTESIAIAIYCEYRRSTRIF
jgi:glutathione S-transferase